MALSESDLYACYRRLEKPLFNVLYRWLWHAQDCQDILHDAFLRLWDRRARIDTQRVDQLAWTTALNLARNRLRWRRLWRFGTVDVEEESSDDPVVHAQRRERDARLRRALEALPRAQRDVLLLAEFGGLDTREIAALLRIPAGTVGSRKHQALITLRSALGEIRDE
ncbi:MAG TPA: RNA polymerase sigma factor [Rudaea sp.]